MHLYNLQKIFKEVARDISAHTETNIIDRNNSDKYLTHVVTDCFTYASSEEDAYMYMYLYLLGIIKAHQGNV